MVDGRNALDGREMAAVGWVYHAYGRGTIYPTDWVEPALPDSAEPPARQKASAQRVVVST
jgi:hypothetical protein